MTGARMKDGLSKRKINYSRNKTTQLLYRRITHAHTHTHYMFVVGFGQIVRIFQMLSNVFMFDCTTLYHSHEQCIMYYAAMEIFNFSAQISCAIFHVHILFRRMPHWQAE